MHLPLCPCLLQRCGRCSEECEKRTLKRRISGWTRLRGWPLTLTRPLPCCEAKSLSMLFVMYIPCAVSSESPNSLNHPHTPNSISSQHHSTRPKCPPDFLPRFRHKTRRPEQRIVFIPCSGRQRWLFKIRSASIHAQFSRRPEPKTHPSSSCRSIAHSGRKPW